MNNLKIKSLLFIISYFVIFFSYQLLLAIFFFILKQQWSGFVIFIWFVVFLLVATFILVYLFQNYFSMVHSRFGTLSWQKLTKGVFSLFFVSIIGNMLQLMIYGEKITKNQAMVQQLLSGKNLVYFSMIIVIIGPLFEELLFRGLLIQKLRELGLRTSGCLLFSSLLFGAIHLSDNVVSFFLYTVMGIILGKIYLNKGYLADSLSVHIVNNLVSIVPIIISTLYK